MNQREWLGLISEAALEPDLPICDPHHHLWDHPGNRYLLEELLEDTSSGHNVVSTVFMECGSMYRASGPESMRPVGETEFVNGIAAMSASGNYGATKACAAIVSFADLNLGSAVGDVLDAHVTASQRFRGIRHAAGWDPSDQVRNSHTSPTSGMLLDKTFRAGFMELSKRQLTFDAWLYHTQISELIDLASTFPDQPIIFDHFGGPLGIGPYEGQRDKIFTQWKDDVRELSACANVVAKLGGLVMPINGFGFHKKEKPATSQELEEVTRPYYEHMISCFGVERCMFESNFPVDSASCSYNILWNSFKRIVSGLSTDDKNSLFHDTATRVYAVDV